MQDRTCQGMVETQQAKPEARGHRRTQIGVVETDGRNKTIKVRIDRIVQHPKYGKYQRRRGSLHVHDEKNEARVGDSVEIVACRPLSKTKSWRLVRVLRVARGA